MNFLKMLVIGILLEFSNFALAGDLSVEIDPSTFAFSGYSAHVKYHFAESWELGLGTYAMTFPNALGSLAISPNSSATTLKITSAYGVFLDRYLFQKSEGLFVGFQLATHNYQLSDSGTPGTNTTYTATLFMPRLGYKYQFTNSGLYILPWVGAGYVAPSNSNPSVGSQNYKVNSVLSFATLHLGYSF